ncbi:hypothetical protein FQA39_LY04004 [Lamprigera yunnana]|nr:hypothetical protein FQA39_LY04004 [Lamprigera yunnana]
MRKSAPVRQLSLHVDTPQQRKNLRKQFSEDASDGKEKWIHPVSPTTLSCTKNQIQKRNNPPTVKEAWIDDTQQILQSLKQSRNQEGIVIKKCKEIKRPSTSKTVKQSSLSNDTILLSHQELAERLRQAWREREKEKQNLNIFLNQHVKERAEEEPNDLTDSECAFPAEVNANKSKKKNNIVPIQSYSHDNGYKSIFQKRMRRTHSVDDSLSDYTYSPIITPENKIKSVVVVPLVDSMKAKENIKLDENSIKTVKKPSSPKGEEHENKPINVIIRPMTAATKREAYRSRVNSAFNTSSTTNFAKRPPLIRSSSVPLKQMSPKPNFVAVKRRLKSATKKKERSAKNVTKDEATDDQFKTRKLQRCMSAMGPDIITMVSLISPEESGNEEQVEVEQAKPQVDVPNSKNSVVEKNDRAEHKNYSFRKAVKSVSFQQSSIHAVRSFSASFPARRGSVVTTLMLKNTSFNKAPMIPPAHEKRTTMEVTEDVREPKRRLLRNKSGPLFSPLDLEDENPDEKPQEANSKNDAIGEKIQPKGDNSNKTPGVLSHNTAGSTKLEPKGESEESKVTSTSEPTFETSKEKQCWEMYRKMSGKGVNVSFETILRGMLTPTEYRLRRKSIVETEHIEISTDGNP